MHNGYIKKIFLFSNLWRFENVEGRLDKVADDENEDDAHEEGGHGGVAAMGVALGDGVVVGVGLNRK